MQGVPTTITVHALIDSSTILSRIMLILFSPFRVVVTAPCYHKVYLFVCHHSTFATFACSEYKRNLKEINRCFRKMNHNSSIFTHSSGNKSGESPLFVNLGGHTTILSSFAQRYAPHQLNVLLAMI